MKRKAYIRIAQALSAALTRRRCRATTSAFSAAISVFQDQGTAEQDEHGHCERGDQERHRGAARVLRSLKEVHHQVADHHPVDAAYQLGGEVLAQDRNENEDHGCDQAWTDLRNHYPPDRDQGRCTKIHRGFELVPVEPFESREKGEGREWKVQIYEHEDDGPPVVKKERKGLVDQAGAFQRPIQDSTLTEDRDPRSD